MLVNNSLDTKSMSITTSFMDDLSLLSDVPHTDIPKEKIIFCPDCWDIPELFLNWQSKRLTSFCSLNNHQNEYSLSEFIDKCNEHSLNNISCNICQCSLLLDPKKNFYYCERCNDFYCQKCEKTHINKKRTHTVVILNKLGNICSYHNFNYFAYCKTCTKNICNKCQNNHYGHEIIFFSDITPKNKEINFKKNEIEKEKNELKKIDIIFRDSINALYNKFNDLMRYKNEIVWLKENIINTFEMKNNNYNSIQNFNKLNIDFEEFSGNFETSTSRDENLTHLEKIKKIFDYLEKNTEHFTRKIFLQFYNNSENRRRSHQVNASKNLEKKRSKDSFENQNSLHNCRTYIEDNSKTLKKNIENKKFRKISDKNSNDNLSFNTEKKSPRVNKEKQNRKRSKESSSIVNSNENGQNEEIFYRDYEKIDQLGIGKYNKNEKNDKNNKNYKNSVILQKVSSNIDKKIKRQEKNLYPARTHNSFNYVKKIKIKKCSDSEREFTEEGNDNSYSYKNVKIPKNEDSSYSSYLNSIEKPKLIRALDDNHKEIINMILLHDGNFCTSSWDQSVKIFDSKTFKLLLIIRDPNNDDVCYVNQLNDDSIILCSSKIYKYRLYNNDTKYTLETSLGGYKDYIIKVIELKNDTLISCDWEYKIKIWEKIDRLKNKSKNKEQYQLVKSDLNSGEHLCSMCVVNGYEFACSSNSHLEQGNDILRFYDSNYENSFNIYDISCSELVDTLVQLNNKYFCVATQKWKNNQYRGLAIIDMYEKKIVKIINDDSMTCLTKLDNYYLFSGGRDSLNKKCYVIKWKIFENGNFEKEYEICTNQKDAITSIIQMNDGTILASNYDSTIAILK